MILFFFFSGAYIALQKIYCKRQEEDTLIFTNLVQEEELLSQKNDEIDHDEIDHEEITLFLKNLFFVKRIQTSSLKQELETKPNLGFCV